MFAWFTGDARGAIVRSQNFARDLLHERVGTQHLLLALLDQPGTVAALALADLGLTLDGVRRAVVERFTVRATTNAGFIPFTSRMWRAVEVAAASPPMLRVGPAQLLLALLEEPESTACQLLRDQAGELAGIRGAVLERLNGAQPASSADLAFGGSLALSSKGFEGQSLAAHNRFTRQARMVNSLSRHMARELMHDRQGTQHLLLGLLARPEELTSSFPPELTRASAPVTSMYPTIAELALADVGVTLGGVRRAVVERCGIGAVKPPGYIGLTPRKQSVIERSLTAAESLHHDRIGPEHLLLALLDEPGSIGNQILADHVGDPSRIRDAVVERLDAVQAQLSAQPRVQTGNSLSQSETITDSRGDGDAVDHRPPRPAASAKPAQWLIDRIDLSSTHWVTRSVGSGFESYARLLHPGDEQPDSPTWAAVARTNRRTVHPTGSWEQFSSPASPEASTVALALTWRAEQNGHIWPGNPRTGLRTWALERLCAILARHTTTPQTCYFAVRADGQPTNFRSLTDSRFPGLSAGPPPGVWQLNNNAPTFMLPHPVQPHPHAVALPDALPLPDTLPSALHPACLKHYYYLLEGPPSDAVRIARWADEHRFLHQSPSFIWPADHAWLVRITSESDSTVIGGSRQLIDELCASSGIEVVQIAPTDDLPD